MNMEEMKRILRKIEGEKVAKRDQRKLIRFCPRKDSSDLASTKISVKNENTDDKVDNVYDFFDLKFK